MNIFSGGDHSTRSKPTVTPQNWHKRLHAWALSKLDDRCERAVADRKRALLGSLHGRILEIGPGPGVNLHYYPRDIDWFGIEPDLSCHPSIREAATARGMRIELHSISTDVFNVDDANMDVVVSMFALCTVSAPLQTLAEVLRVLKPGGKFIFMEHVAAPTGTVLRLVQRASRPGWVRFAEGCLPDADTLPRIEAAGFSCVDAEAFSIPVPLISPHVAGIALR